MKKFQFVQFVQMKKFQNQFQLQELLQFQPQETFCVAQFQPQEA